MTGKQVTDSNGSKAVAYLADQPVGQVTFQAKNRTSELCGSKGDSTRSNNRHRGQNTEAKLSNTTTDINEEGFRLC